MLKEGRKDDIKDDKTRWDLLHLDCLEDIARVFTGGAKKYGENNWQNLDNGYERYKGALLRHLYASETKEFDEETGLAITDYSLFDVDSVNFLYKENDKSIMVHHVGIFYKILGYDNDIKENISVDLVNDDSLGAGFYKISSLRKKDLSKIAILELEKLGYELND